MSQLLRQIIREELRAIGLAMPMAQPPSAEEKLEARYHEAAEAARARQEATAGPERETSPGLEHASGEPLRPTDRHPPSYGQPAWVPTPPGLSQISLPKGHVALLVPDATAAALKLAQILLRRATTSPNGYGYVQTWDAAQAGLMDGTPEQWSLTPLGRAILEASLG